MVPTSHVLRRAQTKSAGDIEAEIAEARESKAEALFDAAPRPGNRRRRRITAGHLAAGLPRPFRRLVIRLILRRNPFFKKRLFGTCSFSAAHIFGQGYGYGLPVTPHPVHMLIGGIERRPDTGRQIACVTLSLDHNIADGAPAIRFINDFKRIVAAGVDFG